MHTSYNCAGYTRKKDFIQSCCTSKPNPYTKAAGLPKGIPESARVMKEVCKEVILTITPVVDCSYQSNDQSTSENPVPNISTTLSYNKILVPTMIGYPIPLQVVEAKAASKTTQQRALSVTQQESDSYNPDTRFSQYFPAPPIPYQCPERIPNNYPLPSTAPCLPIQRFQPSTKK